MMQYLRQSATAGAWVLSTRTENGQAQMVRTPDCWILSAALPINPIQCLVSLDLCKLVCNCGGKLIGASDGVGY
eukprot:scaffold22247_cov14-Prasinocladus_malaysianus.AAC.1